MSYDRNELSGMTLQRLAYVLPQDAQEEELVKEVFEQRASVSSYQTLTNIDVKLGWQEKIIQKYVDERREHMAPENPATLNPEDQGKLDAAVITKEIELELQAKLDAKNGKPVPVVETADEVEPEVTTAETESTPETTIVPKKRGRPAKNHEADTNNG